MLRNPSYAGDLVYARTSNSKFGRRGKRDRDEWIVTQDAHAAIVDRETFEAVQRILTRHRSEQGTTRRTRFLLTSIAYCGRCAGTAGPNGVARNWRIYGHGSKGAYYECSRHAMYGICSLPVISASGMDKAIRETIAEAFSITADLRAKALQYLTAELSARQSVADQERADLARSLQEHKRKRLTLARRIMDNLVPEDVYRELEGEEVEAITVIERTLATMPVNPPEMNVSPILEALGGFTWDDLTFEGWRQVAILLISKVVIHGRGDFSIEWVPAADELRKAVSTVSGYGSRKLG